MSNGSNNSMPLLRWGIENSDAEELKRTAGEEGTLKKFVLTQVDGFFLF